MVMNNNDIITALETGVMPNPNDRFNTAPSGRPEFGQVYVIPAALRNAIISELKSHAAAKASAAKAKPVKQSPNISAVASEAVPAVKGKKPE